MLNKKIVKNVGWNIGGKFLAQAIFPLFTILIARILNPDDFGLFAIAAAVIGFIEIIKDLGISQAIIIEQDDNNLISMQFTVQLFLGVIIYAIIFILAKYIAFWFEVPALKIVLIIYGLMIFIYCLEYPLETFYMKSNKYNVLFYRQILPVLLYGVITYLLALKGFGVFALIIGYLSGRAMTVCFLLVRSGWKPKLYFNLAVFSRLFNLGKHILAFSVCGFFVTQVDSLIVGKILGIYNLGFYKTGNTLSYLIPNTVTPQVQKVVFSDIAQRKNDYNYYNLRYYQYFYIIGLISFILSIATYFLSPIVIPAIMGSKWNPMIPLVQIFSVSLPTGMIVGLNYDYSKILGFGYIYTILGIIRVAVTLIAIYIGSLFSLELTVICLVVVSLLDNVASEICFFGNQGAIKYNSIKLIFFIFAWLWAAYAIFRNYIKA
ncbi:MAG: oligosaccharide flippase family protein [Candidatus Omnitrophica bacterium]|nr:oligosaccharide flippase family protein [Candidatus Omnitrophota bacterium]